MNKRMNKKRGIVIIFLILSLITISIYVVASNFIDIGATWTGTFSNTTNNNNINISLISNSSGLYENQTGTYLSKVFDANTTASWNNVSWVEMVPYQEELPNNLGVETVSHGANMTGNVLLMYMNNDWNDESGNSNDGTAYNGVTFSSSSKLGSHAGSFDGDNDYVEVLDDNSLDFGSGAFSIELWMNAESQTETYPAIIEKGNGDWTTTSPLHTGWWFGYLWSGNYCFRMSDYKYEYDSICVLGITNEGWKHIVISVDSGSAGSPKIKIYKNGALYDSITRVLTGSTDTADNLNIGRWKEFDRTYKGKLDELAIYNRALSAVEIRDHYLRGAAGLNISVHDCDDAACSGEESTWDTTCENASYCDISAVSDARYFQYKATLTTDLSNYTPALNNVSIYYDAYPNITLNSPTNNNNSINLETTLQFNCSAIDGSGNLNNLSLYHNLNGTWRLNQTVSISGYTDSVIFNISKPFGNLTMKDNTFTWNCLVYDDSGNSDWGDSNYTFSGWDLGTYNVTELNVSTAIEMNFTFPFNISNEGDGTFTVVYRPAAGNNDGNDEGNFTHGKDAALWWDIYGADQNNYGTAGSLGPLKFVSGALQRGLIQFDISLLEGYAKSINSANLSTYVSWVDTSWTWTSGIYRVTASWNEMTATWANAASSTAELVDSHYFGYPRPIWGNYAVTTIVQQWFDGTYSNYGLQFRFTNEGDPVGDGERRSETYSSDTGASTRPYLTINAQLSTQNGSYLSNVKDAGFTVRWVNINWGESLPGGVTNISVSLHSCDDSVCSGEENTWDVNCTDSSSCDLSGMTNTQYMQYRVNFESTNILDYTPQLYNVTISYDLAPFVTTPIILPSTAYTNTTLTANTTYTDANSDVGTVYFEWYKNGTYLLTTTNSSISSGTEVFATLGSGNFSKNDNISVNVTANDGTENSTLKASAVLQISNTAPGVPTINLTPDFPLNYQTLYCNVTINSTDADNDSINYTYEWYNNSVWFKTTLNTADLYDTVGYGNTTPGEVWNCTVIPFDGTDNGTRASDTVTITFENITIRNIGQIGFNETNQEYTALRTVLLLLNFSTNNAVFCRYKNSGESYDNWDTCTGQKYWLLSSGYGLKQVFYQINHTDNNLTEFNDTIYYNYTGAGLDTTAPTPPIITDGDYTNVNTSLYITWTNAADPESTLLNIPLIYSYTIFVNGNFNKTESTTLTYFNETGFNFQHNDNITVNITVINSAGLTSSNVSDGLIIDLLEPLPTTITSSIPENIWNSTNSATFNWNSSDNLSGIAAYSYILSATNDEPDNIPEGSLGNLENELNKTYSNLADNIYYFKVKAKDSANNWGNISNYTIKIDATAPDKPNFLSEVFNSAQKTITYNYTNVSDTSGIPLYQINITNITGGTSTVYNNSNITSFQLNNTFHTNYYFKVRARNGALLWSIWSDETTIVSDIIKPSMWVKPQGTITSKTPIFVVKTNEQAVCKYSNLTNPSDADFTNFSYTNSTYHETRVTSNGGTYNITCTDIYGNVNSTLITFTYTINNVTSAPSIATTTAFIGEIVNITLDTAENYGELDKSRVKLYINNVKSNDYNLIDEGYGNYTIILKAPPRATSYTINVTTDSSSTTTTLNVFNLTLTINYTKAGLATQNRTRIVYSDYANYTVGLATDSDIVDIQSDASKMQIKSYIKDSGLIVVTDRIDNPARKEHYLEYGNFFNLFKPSFGYTIGQYNEIKIILNYNNYNINGSEELFKGQRNLLITYIGDEGDKKIIDLTTSNLPETTKEVYKYEG